MDNFTGFRFPEKVHIRTPRTADSPQMSNNLRKMFHSRRCFTLLDKTWADLEYRDNNVGTYALISSTTTFFHASFTVTVYGGSLVLVLQRKPLFILVENFSRIAAVCTLRKRASNIIGDVVGAKWMGCTENPAHRYGEQAENSRCFPQEFGCFVIA